MRSRGFKSFLMLLLFGFDVEHCHGLLQVHGAKKTHILG